MSEHSKEFSNQMVRNLRVIALMVCLFCCGGLGLLSLGAQASTTVTVTAEQAQASRLGPAPGLFKLTRTGSTTAPLSVHFALSGTAKAGIDYLIWETTAWFEVGMSAAHVAVLPRNTAHATGNQTIIFTLSPGQGYTIGSPAKATVQLQDYFVGGYAGVWCPTNPNISPNLTYLDAQIQNGMLKVMVGLAATAQLANVHLFLDADQNPATGDYRAGHVGGADYRIDAVGGVLAGTDYSLYKLPTAPPPDPTTNPEDDIFIANGTVTANASFLQMSVPLSKIGNPSRVDVYAASDIGSGEVSTLGVGNRAPNYGVFDTATRQVVVRRPQTTQEVHLTQTVGSGSVNGLDLRSMDITTIADQTAIKLTFSGTFDPSNSILSPGPNGAVVVDGDRNLLTGAWFMGDQIPTWGGDLLLSYDISSLPGSGVNIILQTDILGNPILWGQGKNDGSWLSQGNTLFLTGSTSLYDAFLSLYDKNGNALPKRIMTDGRMFAHAYTMASDEIHTAVNLPGKASAADTRTGQILAPYVWDPKIQVTAKDSQNDGNPGISGMELIRIDGEVTDNKLIVKGTLSAWLNTDYGNIFGILLDTDMNVATAPLGQLTNTFDNGPTIGVDADYVIQSADSNFAVIYAGGVNFPDGSSTRSDAALLPEPTGDITLPGSFTVTIPLSALSNVGPKVRLYLTTAYAGIPGLADIAAPQPMVLSVPGVASVKLSTVTTDSASVSGGRYATGIVTLSAPAPAGGIVVALSSSTASVATVPMNVTVAPGSLSASFIVATKPVHASTKVTLTASYGKGVTQSSLTVHP